MEVLGVRTAEITRKITPETDAELKLEQGPWKDKNLERSLLVLAHRKKESVTSKRCSVYVYLFGSVFCLPLII